MNKPVSFLFPLIMFSLCVPCEDTYIIQIPRTVDLSETQSFQINIIENDLGENQILHIDMPDQFYLSDLHGRDDITGTLSGNHITYTFDDLSSKDVTIRIPALPAGEWSCELPITIRIEEAIPSNVLIDGPALNQILQQADPVSVTFSDETVPGSPLCDVSLAQDDSILLYCFGDEVIISNGIGIPIIANEDMSETFSSLSSLVSINSLDLLDLSECHDISGMFSHDVLLNRIDGLEDLDLSSVSDMSSLFCDTGALSELDLSAWNTSSIRNISHMFEDSQIISLNISSWDTGSVTDMSFLFHNCSQIASVSIGSWDTSSVTDMTSMFDYCSRLKTLSLSGWDLSSCNSIKDMFAGCSSLTGTGALDLWDLSSCTDLSGLFDSCSKLRNIGDLSSWQTSQVMDMSKMFRNCSRLTSLGDLGGWNVENVQNFSQMFANASSLNGYGDLSLWNISSCCEDLSNMFQNSASALPSSLNLSNWDVSCVADMSHMFENSYTLTVLDISGWNTSSLCNAASMFSFRETGRLSPLSQIIGIDSIDTSSLENISAIFYEDQYLSCDLSSWDTASLQDISFAFYGAYRFDIDKTRHWNVSSVLDMTDAFGDNAGVLIQSPVPDWYH